MGRDEKGALLRLIVGRGDISDDEDVLLEKVAGLRKRDNSAQVRSCGMMVALGCLDPKTTFLTTRGNAFTHRLPCDIEQVSCGTSHQVNSGMKRS